MWQTICLCLPAVTRSEQERIFARFGEAAQTSTREPGEMDIGLSFLHSLSTEEALTVLEERLDLVIRSQELIARSPRKEIARDSMAMVIDDHIQTLLAAELDWLNRTIAHVRSISMDSNRRTGDLPVLSR